MARDYCHLRLDTSFTQMLLQCGPIRIFTKEPEQRRLPAKRFNIHRHIGCAARTLIVVNSAHNWHWCLWGDPRYITPNITVEHDITEYEDMGVTPGAFDQFNNPMERLNHGGNTIYFAEVISETFNSIHSQRICPHK